MSEEKASPPKRDREGARLQKLTKRYGLTIEEFAEIYMKQGGRCAICLKSLKEKRSLCVDHSHVTNEVRGLLCSNCNVALGMFKDNALFLARAQMYLLTYQKDLK